jgi:curved DNA-binding protein CbpA
MSKIEIDFNNLKYNLYEILNVMPDSSDVKIKKSFMKLIKTFHPDKNSDLEEEIYYHIILANQILLNKDSRNKYDDYLFNKADTFNELKDTFNKVKKEVDNNIDKEKAKVVNQNLFNNRVQELNKKHGFNYDDNKDKSVNDKFTMYKMKRNNDIEIPKETFKDTKDFNTKFHSNKMEGKFKDQIVEYKGGPSELSTYISGTNYTSLEDMDKLYIEDTIQTSKFSSLDRAFTLQPVIDKKLSNDISSEDRMKNYKSMTEEIKNMKPTDYSTKKYSEL